MVGDVFDAGNVTVRLVDSTELIWQECGPPWNGERGPGYREDSSGVLSWKLEPELSGRGKEVREQEEAV